MTVVFKGSPECIKVQLSSAAPFSDVLREFSEKMNSYRHFFGKGVFKAAFIGRRLLDEEKAEIEAVVAEVVGQWVVCYEDGTHSETLRSEESWEEVDRKTETTVDECKIEEPPDEIAMMLKKWDDEAKEERLIRERAVEEITKKWDKEIEANSPQEQIKKILQKWDSEK